MQSEVLEMLNKYGNNVKCMLEGEKLELHGDNYFDCLDEWISKLDLQGAAPRNKKLVFDSFFETLENPLFVMLKDTERFDNIKKSIESVKKNQEN